jgi:hypothetical protein
MVPVAPCKTFGNLLVINLGFLSQPVLREVVVKDLDFFQVFGF